MWRDDGPAKHQSEYDDSWAVNRISKTALGEALSGRKNGL
jgi:hypothetical protein